MNGPAMQAQANQEEPTYIERERECVIENGRTKNRKPNDKPKQQPASFKLNTLKRMSN